MGEVLTEATFLFAFKQKMEHIIKLYEKRIHVIRKWLNICPLIMSPLHFSDKDLLHEIIVPDETVVLLEEKMCNSFCQFHNWLNIGVSSKLWQTF